MQAIGETREQFGLDFSEHYESVKCARGHVFQAMQTRPPHYSGSPRCDQCRWTSLESHKVYYHCGICKYDLCRYCMLIRMKRLQPLMVLK